MSEDEGASGEEHSAASFAKSSTTPSRVLSVLSAIPKKAKSEPGVVYISRVPPYMKPAKVQHLLSLYGEVGRVFLTPEGLSALLSHHPSFCR
jgi:hypothetical protein